MWNFTTQTKPKVVKLLERFAYLMAYVYHKQTADIHAYDVKL